MVRNVLARLKRVKPTRSESVGLGNASSVDIDEISSLPLFEFLFHFSLHFWLDNVAAQTQSLCSNGRTVPRKNRILGHRGPLRRIFDLQTFGWEIIAWNQANVTRKPLSLACFSECRSLYAHARTGLFRVRPHLVVPSRLRFEAPLSLSLVLTVCRKSHIGPFFLQDKLLLL